jgi:SH3-like domain-containing protein
VFCVVVGSCLGSAWRRGKLERIAVVVTQDAAVRNGPLEVSPTAFTAHDGAELKVVDQKDDWLRVSAGPRHVGWLQKSQVVLLK